MTDELIVRMGIKIDAEELATLNPAEIGIGTTDRPAESEVEGQAVYWRLYMCPNCSRVTWIRYDTTRYLWFRCGGGGCVFRL